MRSNNITHASYCNFVSLLSANSWGHGGGLLLPLFFICCCEFAVLERCWEIGSHFCLFLCNDVGCSLYIRFIVFIKKKKTNIKKKEINKNFQSAKDFLGYCPCCSPFTASARSSAQGQMRSQLQLWISPAVMSAAAQEPFKTCCYSSRVKVNVAPVCVARKQLWKTAQKESGELVTLKVFPFPRVNLTAWMCCLLKLFQGPSIGRRGNYFVNICLLSL